ncbi:MAG: DNA gyrase C-terminal beta-propeller domain-containing protein [Candidatus Hydrothermarchaeota archaeon]
MVTSKEGMVIRIPVRGIRQTGRSTSGVKLMNLNPGDEVMAVARLVKEEEQPV